MSEPLSIDKATEAALRAFATNPQYDGDVVARRGGVRVRTPWIDPAEWLPVPAGGTKGRGRVRVRPYVREGRPVSGYEQVRELAGDLIRGARRPKGRGRKGLKRDAAGAVEFAKGERATPVLKQDQLKRQYDSASRHRAAGWVHVTRDDGEHYEKGNWRMVSEQREIDGRIHAGVRVYVGDEDRGWISTSGDNWGLSAQELFDKVVPPSEHPHQQFLDEWWGAPGRPGRYQTISGDPGTEFEKQHERIMEVGARLDAELAKRTALEERTYRRLTKQVDQMNRERKKLAKEKEAIEYEVAARTLVEQNGWDPELTTPETVAQRHRAYLRAVRKDPDRHTDNDRAVLRANEDVYWAVGRAGTDPRVMEISKRQYELTDQRPDADRRVVRQELIRARRDHAYRMLREIRDFGGDYDAAVTHDAEPLLRRASVYLPSDWIDSSNDLLAPYLNVGWAAERGHYRHSFRSKVEPNAPQSEVLVSPSGGEEVGLLRGESVMLHELVHRAESTHDGISGAEWTYYASRVSPYRNARWEDPKRLSELTGVQAFKPTELSRPDDFIDAYSGKTYGDNMDSSYEILSMGIEDLVSGRHDILIEDEEYRQFVLGALATL